MAQAEKQGEAAAWALAHRNGWSKGIVPGRMMSQVAEHPFPGTQLKILAAEGQET